MIDLVEDPFLTTGQVAKLFGVKPYTIRQWIKDDKMKAKKINGQLRIRRSEVNRVAQEAYGDEGTD